jgi:hypothetical protein
MTLITWNQGLLFERKIYKYKIYKYKIVRHMTSFRAPTRFSFSEQKFFFYPHIAGSANIPENARCYIGDVVYFLGANYF